MKFDGAWVMITGGSSGIGLTIARKIAPAARRVTLVAHEKGKLERARGEIQALTAICDTFAYDFRIRTEVEALAAALLNDGGPDIVINNAGAAVYRSFAASSAREIEDLLNVNFVSHVILTKALLAPMLERKRGAVCFMSSIGGRLPITPNAMYAGAKHGMVGLAATLRAELSSRGIEVTAVCPGRVDTPFFDHPTFADRSSQAELKGVISADRAAQATIDAIEKNRARTVVPRALRLADWAFHALPVLTHPLFDRIVQRRMNEIYVRETASTD